MAQEWITWIQGAVWASRLLRLCRGRGLVHAVRSRAMATPIATLHNNVISEVSALSATARHWEEAQDRVVEQAVRVCSACRDVLAELLQLDFSMLSCRIKLLTEGSGKGGDSPVFTLASSAPFDGRPRGDGASGPQASQNTAWSAIMGCFDGHTRWRPMPCFCCNDLSARASLFACHIRGWQNFYKSTLVFPLRYKIAPERFEQIGFLAFDSPTCEAFIGFPESFDFRDHDQWNEYNSRLTLSSTYNLGGIMANLVSECLKASYEVSARDISYLEYAGAS
jgi:hypothetical protein